MSTEEAGVDFLNALAAHLSAIAGRDIDKFAASVADGVRLVGTNGSIIEGRDAAVAAHRQWFSDSDWRLDASDRVFATSEGRVGWALVRVCLQSGAAQDRFNLFLLFRREDDGVWRLQYDQGTTIPRT